MGIANNIINIAQQIIHALSSLVHACRFFKIVFSMILDNYGTRRTIAISIIIIVKNINAGILNFLLLNSFTSFSQYIK